MRLIMVKKKSVKKKTKTGGKYFTDTDSMRPKQSAKSITPDWAMKPESKKPVAKKKAAKK
jgi:hypothetical protein